MTFKSIANMNSQSRKKCGKQAQKVGKSGVKRRCGKYWTIFSTKTGQHIRLRYASTARFVTTIRINQQKQKISVHITASGPRRTDHLLFGFRGRGSRWMKFNTKNLNSSKHWMMNLPTKSKKKRRSWTMIGTSKIFERNFRKPLDNRGVFCYNGIEEKQTTKGVEKQ